MQNSINLEDAKKAIILSQGLYHSQTNVTDVENTYNLLKSINYIQIDTISVVERAHHHSFWNRSQDYKPNHLDTLLADKKIFEYWSHAAAYLPIENFRYSLIRKKAFSTGEEGWFKKDAKTMKFVLERIQSEGQLQSKDFKDTRDSKNEWWDFKPAKRALEQLFMQGDIMIAKREGFHKVYDLTERVIPSHIDTTIPSEPEYFEHLIVNYLKANAIGTSEQFTYLLKGIKAPVKKHCERMVEDGKLIIINANNKLYFALPNFSCLLDNKISFNTIKILSPFDNLLIQRKRTKEIFNYDYQIECYVPAAKRKFGYFSLPLLWKNNLVGRMDSKIDRKLGILNILHLHIEIKINDEFITELKASINKFLSFNKGEFIKIKMITSSIENLSNKQIINIISILDKT
jgi:uncharacterized protein YcaQ